AASLAEADATFVGAPSSAVGSALSGVGDLDADGRADVLVAGFYANTACFVPGAVADGEHLLADAACLDGEAVYDFAGYAVAGGDGALVVAAIGNDEAGIEAGKVYVHRGAPGADGALADAPIAWLGEAPGDYAGTSVALAGDVDGDGDGDLLVGAPGNDAGGAGGGRVYLLRGPFADGVAGLGDAPATFTGASTAASRVRAHGSATGGDALGDAVAGVGDLDGDGLADVALGAGGSDAAGDDSGEVWLLRGPITDGDHRSADADARRFGPGPGAYAGAALAGAGDLDGDGLDDVLVAADGWEGGRVYVLLGPVADGAGDLAETGPVLAGANVGDVAGWAVAGAGDTDADGRREVLVGAPGVDVAGVDAGAVYLVRDAARPGVALLEEVGERWLGEASGDAAGRALAGVGDTDGDGWDDLLVGALYNQAGGVFAGKAYLRRGDAE
ncbi:MAG: integrin alpha, partial [Myxococcota bacterium]